MAGWGNVLWQKSKQLITGRFIGLLVGLSFQHPSIRKQCNDTNDNKKHDAEYKHHSSIPIRPVSSFDDRVNRRRRSVDTRLDSNGRHIVFWGQTSVSGQSINLELDP